MSERRPTDHLDELLKDNGYVGELLETLTYALEKLRQKAKNATRVNTAVCYGLRTERAQKDKTTKSGDEVNTGIHPNSSDYEAAHVFLDYKGIPRTEEMPEGQSPRTLTLDKRVRKLAECDWELKCEYDTAMNFLDKAKVRRGDGNVFSLVGRINEFAMNLREEAAKPDQTEEKARKLLDDYGITSEGNTLVEQVKEALNRLSTETAKTGLATGLILKAKQWDEAMIKLDALETPRQSDELVILSLASRIETLGKRANPNTLQAEHAIWKALDDIEIPKTGLPHNSRDNHRNLSLADRVQILVANTKRNNKALDDYRDAHAYLDEHGGELEPGQALTGRLIKYINKLKRDTSKAADDYAEAMDYLDAHQIPATIDTDDMVQEELKFIPLTKRIIAFTQRQVAHATGITENQPMWKDVWQARNTYPHVEIIGIPVTRDLDKAKPCPLAITCTKCNSSMVWTEARPAKPRKALYWINDHTHATKTADPLAEYEADMTGR